MSERLTQTQKDGYWLAVGMLAAAGFNAGICWRYGPADPLGAAALFVAGLMVGAAIAAVSIVNERMKINRIFGRDVYARPNKETQEKSK